MAKKCDEILEEMVFFIFPVKKKVERSISKLRAMLMFPPRIELRTFSVLGRRDNHYTMET